MHFSNVWAHAQATRCDAVAWLALKTWRWLFEAPPLKAMSPSATLPINRGTTDDNRDFCLSQRGNMAVEQTERGACA